MVKLRARGSQSQSPLAGADKLEIAMGTNQAYMTVDARHQTRGGVVNVQQPAVGAEGDKDYEAMETRYQTAGPEEVIYEHPTA